MNSKSSPVSLRKSILSAYSLVLGVSFPLPLLAQTDAPRLEEVVVTAQKREQDVQDIAIAVTAIDPEAMAVNRVFNVSDISGLAPNLTARPSPGGVNTVSFSMRGVTSYGSLPGTDKQISTYLDGVYLGNPRGSIFNLPNIERIEVLRGPQGTLFGRNATAGAISITTRNPSGEFALMQEISFGNKNHRRMRTTVDLPAIGALNLAVSYVNEEKDGDIDNVGAGTQWDRTPINLGTQTSPKTLGDVDTESFFFAASYTLSDTMELVYKYDRNTEEGTPGASAAIGFYPSPTVLGVQGAQFLGALLAANPEAPINTGVTRPDKVSNSFHTSRDQEMSGHSLTLTWELDDVLIKNISAYRESEIGILGTNLVAGLELGFLGPAFGGLPADTPVCVICSHAQGDSEHWSNELQVIYQHERFTLTTGALYYESKDSTGIALSPETLSFSVFPFAMVAPSASGLFTNEANSTAAYLQTEYHLNDTVDVIAGYRWTEDEKLSEYQLGTPSAPSTINDDYKDNNSSYLLGLNYTPSDDMLIYAKYSTAFVSGGSIAGVGFSQEDATSYEVGIKADLLDKRLRSNLSIFDVTYENLQTLNAGSNVGRPEISVVVIDLGGDVESQGFELELTALPSHQLTLSASVGYTDVEFSEVRDILRASNGGNVFANSDFLPTLVPEWTSNLSMHYETAPLFQNAYASFSLNGIWHSKIRLDSNPGRSDAVSAFQAIEYTPASWVINARATLHDIDVGFANGELAVWGRNLSDNDEPVSALIFGSFAASANYMEARSYGVDFKLTF